MKLENKLIVTWTHKRNGTQQKLRVTFLSNEHLQQFIHRSLQTIVLSCNLKRINLILRPGYTVSFALQTSYVLSWSRRAQHSGHTCLQLFLLLSVLLPLTAWPEQLTGPAISRLLWTSAFRASCTSMSRLWWAFGTGSCTSSSGVSIISGVLALGRVKTRWHTC